MATIDTAINTLHLLFGGLWAGAVVFFAWRIRPLVAAGTLDVESAERLVSDLRWLTRGGALVFVATGGHMAATTYPDGALFSTGRGHVVIAMLLTWLVVTGLVEVGAGKMLGELDEGRLRTAGKATRLPFLAAGWLSVGLLVLGGYLAS